MINLKKDPINKIFDDIINIIQSYMKNYYIKKTFDPDNNIFCIISEKFSLFYINDKELFYLSFYLGTTCQESALITTYINDIIASNYLVILEDSFWDENSSSLKYGDEAVHAKYEDYLNQQGKVKCPLCNNIVFKKNIL